MEVIFCTSCAFLLTVFLVSMVLALHNNQVTKYFLWVWAALVTLALPFMNRTDMTSYIVTDPTLAFFFYVLYIATRYGMGHVDISREETRRTLAKLSRRIDEERRILAHCLYDEMNPQFLFTRDVLKQLEPLMAGNGRVAELLSNAPGILNGAHAEMRDIIKNTRAEMIDPIGSTAALGSLMVHHTSISEKPAITLEHDLPKRPAMPEASAVSAYKIIREVIFNIIERSKVTQVRVSIHHNKALDIYRAEIIDDGVGMKATAHNGEYVGTGLIDMRERVRVLGDALKIQTANPTNQKRSGAKLSFSFSGQLS